MPLLVALVHTWVPEETNWGPCEGGRVLSVPVCESGWAEEPEGGGAFVCSCLGWQEQRVL